MRGGGFIVESLDQFETAMRRLCKGAGVQVCAVDYKLAPEYQWPVQIEEGEFEPRAFLCTDQRPPRFAATSASGRSANGPTWPLLAPSRACSRSSRS